MAVDICSEISSLSISPRISFSHDLNQTNDHHHHHHHDRRILDSSSDFDFCIVNDDDFIFGFSSADELFSNGKMLPVEIKTKESNHPKFSDDSLGLHSTGTARANPSSSITDHKEDTVKLFSTSTPRVNPSSSSTDLLSISTARVNPSSSSTDLLSTSTPRANPSPRVSPSSISNARAVSTGPEPRIIRLKEFLSASLDSDSEEDEKARRNSSGAHQKSFWQFQRSSSLNLDKIKSLHFMSRSNSTGSVPTRPKKPAGPGRRPKPCLRKQQSLNASSSSGKASYYKRTSSFSSGANNYYYNYGNGNNATSSKGFPRSNNGVRVVSPVLNLPQPYISRVTVSFFGFGSLFCNGKKKKK